MVAIVDLDLGGFCERLSYCGMALLGAQHHLCLLLGTKKGTEYWITARYVMGFLCVTKTVLIPDHVRPKIKQKKAIRTMGIKGDKLNRDSILSAELLSEKLTISSNHGSIK